MKKLIIAMTAVAMVGGAYADMYAQVKAGFGVYGNGANGGIVDNTPGTDVVLQVISGGGDGLQSAPVWNAGTLQFELTGNDVMVGVGFGAVTANPGVDYSDYASASSGAIVDIAKQAHDADLWIRVSGLNSGDWVWQNAIVAADADYSDPKTLPEIIQFDNGGAGGAADGSLTLTVVPEPATIGLMGIAGLGLFLARRKARR